MLNDIIKFVRLIPVLQPVYARFPKGYLTLAALLTAVGYSFLAFFPLMTVIFFFTLFGQISSAAGIVDWIFVLIHIAFLSLVAVTSFFIFTSKFLPPTGVELDWEKPDKLIDEMLLLVERYSCRSFDNVIFTPDYSISVCQTPRYSLPLFTHTTLCIGLPTLLCLSPDHFKGSLARVIGQYSGQYDLLTNWINRSTKIWRHYLHAYKNGKNPFHKFLYYFFSIYCPLTEAISFFAIQKDELKSDHYVLDVINDNDVVAMIGANIVNPEFLDKKFWPKIQSMARKNPSAPGHLPFDSMTNAIAKGLTHEEKERWLKAAYSASIDFSHTLPGLRERMYSLGHEEIIVPSKFNFNAAKHYLGEYASEVISTMDQIWLQRLQLALNVIKDPKTTKNSFQEDDPLVVQLRDLQKKTKESALSEQEVFELARLTSKIEGKNAGLKIYNRILKHRPNDVKILYSIGRLLLGNNDVSGVKVLTRAMELNPKCQGPACRMISKYYLKSGDSKSADKWQAKSTT
ncbi:MAG: tetratricopeptide repeat protein [Gammaproteobacteria bacterium]